MKALHTIAPVRAARATLQPIARTVLAGLLLAASAMGATGQEMATTLGRRDVPPFQPVDPDPSLCCMTGQCCPGDGSQGDKDALIQLGTPLTFKFTTLTPGRALPEASGELVANEAVGSDEERPICRSASGVAPLVLRRSLALYGASAEFARCHEAASALLAMRRTHAGSYTHRLSDIVLTDDDRRHYAVVLMAYRSACLTGSDSDLARTVFGVAAIARVKQSAGSISTGDGALRCGGALIGNHLFTARHCLIGKPGTDGVSLALSVGPDWQFATFAVPEQPIDLSQAKIPVEQRRYDGRREDDWVSLVLPASAVEGLDTGDMEVRAPRPWERVMVIAHNRHAIELAAIRRSLGAPDHSLELLAKEASLDASPLCRAAIIDGRIIYHACQTDVTTSGSPLFAIDETGSPALVAVQAGRAEAAAPLCERMQRLITFYPNFAVALPETIRGAPSSR